MSEGQLSPIDEDQEPLHDREDKEHRECDLQIENTDFQSFKADSSSKSENGDDVTETMDGRLGSNKPDVDVEEDIEKDGFRMIACRAGSSNLYLSRRGRKMRTLADILKTQTLCATREINPSKEDESARKSGGDSFEDNPLGDELSVPLYREMKKFAPRKRRYFSGEEREGALSVRHLFKWSKKPNTQKPGRVHKRTKTLEALKDVKANILKDFGTAEKVFPESEVSICIHDVTSASKKNEGGNPVGTLSGEENAANETTTILDDVPIEILELLQSNFQKNHQQLSGHSDVDVARLPGIDDESTVSAISYLQDRNVRGGDEFSNPRRARRRKKHNIKDGTFISAQSESIEAHLNQDSSHLQNPSSCNSKVNSPSGSISQKGNEYGSNETLSAMQLLRLVDPAVPLNLKQDVSSFDSCLAQNRDTSNQASSFDELSANPQKSCFNSSTPFGKNLFLKSGKKGRRKNPGSAGQKVKKTMVSSIQFEYKSKGGAEDPLRGGQPELGFCALNMNPADFCTVNARSKLYMISYKDLNPSQRHPMTKKQRTVFHDSTERETLLEG